MSTDWSSGYVTDLGYTYGFYRDLTPAVLQFAALVQGFGTCLKPSGAIAYCELGCGQGFSANLLAAANPNMIVHATDFNPEHIARAQQLANSAGTTNVHFYDDSFAEFEARSDLPQFDIIALHGIYSWIAREHRETIVRFIDARLKPGGLVYISYNCFPGWAGAAPMRQLMRLEAARTSGSIPAKIDAALALMEELQSVGARYFKTVPGIKERIERLKGMSRNYLAHEYLNADWTIFHHSEVAEELSRARLSYVGSASLLESVDAINLTAEQQSLLQKFTDATTRESLRDYITNRQFRCDVFARGAMPLSTGESRERWLDTKLVLTTPADDIPMKVKGALGEANLQEGVYGPLIETFSSASGSARLRQMVQDKRVASLGWERLQQAISILVGAGHLQPCLSESSTDAKRKKGAKAFNNAVIERAVYSADLQYLAAPEFGGAIMVDRFQQLFLLGITRNEADPVNFAWRKMKEQNQKIIKDGIALQSDEENISELGIKYKKFENRLIVMKNIGII